MPKVDILFSTTLITNSLLNEEVYSIFDTRNIDLSMQSIVITGYFTDFFFSIFHPNYSSKNTEGKLTLFVYITL